MGQLQQNFYYWIYSFGARISIAADDTTTLDVINICGFIGMLFANEDVDACWSGGI